MEVESFGGLEGVFPGVEEPSVVGVEDAPGFESVDGAFDGCSLPTGWGQWFVEREPGPYDLRLQLPGFSGDTKLANLDLTADQPTTIDATAHAHYQRSHQRLTHETIS